MTRRLAFIVCMCLIAASPALAVNPSEMLSDPALEERAREVSKHLRCVVCQNQSIDDSDAELARDMRVLVRERIESGDSNKQVLDYMVSRYGDFVLLKPPFKVETYALWFGPPIIFILGIIAVVAFARQRRVPHGTSSGAAALSDEERQKLNRLMDEDR